MFHGYFYIEVLSLTAGQKTTLVDQLQQMGLKNNSLYPHERNHWRTRPDNNAVIFEAVFDDTLLTAESIKTRLVNIFNVPSNQVTFTTTQTAYGPVVTYTYSNVQRLRLGIFGGLSATLQQSRDAVLAFLAANGAAWTEIL